MKIDFIPSERTLNKAREVARLKSEGKTYDQIAEIVGNHRTYIFALRNLLKKEEHENS